MVRVLRVAPPERRGGLRQRVPAVLLPREHARPVGLEGVLPRAVPREVKREGVYLVP